MRLALATLALTVVLIGCGGPRAYVQWRHTDPNEDRFAVDRYACVQESRVSWSAGGNIWLMAAASANADAQSANLFALCMRARGWTATRVYAQQPPPLLQPISTSAPIWCSNPGDQWDGQSCYKPAPPIASPSIAPAPVADDR